MKRIVPKNLLPFSEPTQGLSLTEVFSRREVYGSNHVTLKQSKTWFSLALDTTKDPMIWFLLICGAAYLFLGSTLEAWILWISILPLAAMDAFLHRRTAASTMGLSRRLATFAKVTRKGTELRLPVEEIVPGDLVIMEAGDYIPADGIFLKSTDVQVDESSLTGESFPVAKAMLPTSFQTGANTNDVYIEEAYWGFAGTRLLVGKASMQVIFTGAQTLYGQIIRSATESTKSRTPLQRAISRLVSALLGVAGFLCILLAFIRLRQGYGWIDAFMSAATLAVAAIPEEFPVVFTIFLGVGIFRLARHKALVQRAVCVENIGRISSICVDKTGTLTEGQVRLVELVPTKEFSEDRLLEIASLASRHESHDPLDEAILNELKSRKINIDIVEILETFPFTEDRRRETAVVLTRDKKINVATKGSPEVVLELCHFSQAEYAGWENQFLTLGSQGKKVIACAVCLPNEHGKTEPSGPYQFAGFLAFEDPVRAGVKEAISLCQQAGIHVLMMTGDHPSTALAVARSIGLGSGHPTLRTGEELSADPINTFNELQGVHIVARSLPAQKKEIVEKLQSQGEVVAVTGDGVNDVPALQKADIGIAMGERGVQTAREIASIVLLDDNFTNIVRAIAEGRQLFSNLKRSFTYLLLVHIPLVLTATLIPLMGYPLLYLPIHIIWLETLIHPTAILAFQERRADALGTMARADKLRFFTRTEWLSIALCGGMATFAMFVLFRGGLGLSRDVMHARAGAMAFLILLSAGTLAFLSRLRTPASRLIFSLTLISALVFIQIPALSTLLHMSPLHARDWGLVLCLLGTVSIFSVFLWKPSKRSF